MPLNKKEMSKPLYYVYDRPSFIPKGVIDSKRQQASFDWSQLLNDKYGLGVGNLKDYIGVDDSAFIDNPSAYTLSNLNDAALGSLKGLTKYDSPISPVFINDSYHLNQSRPHVGGKLLNPVLARKALYKMSPEYIERLAFNHYIQESADSKAYKSLQKDLEKEGFNGIPLDPEKFRTDPKYREFFAKKYLGLEGVKERLLYERNQPIEYNAISTSLTENSAAVDKNWNPIYTNVSMEPKVISRRSFFPSTIIPHERNHYENAWLGRYLLPDYNKARSIEFEDNKGYTEAINELQRKKDVFAPNHKMLETLHRDYVALDGNQYIHSAPESRGRYNYREDFINPEGISHGDRIPLSRFSMAAPGERLIPSLNDSYLGSSTIGDQDPPDDIATDFDFPREGRVDNSYLPIGTDYQFRNYYESTEESMADLEALRDYLFKEYGYDYTDVNSKFTEKLYEKIRKDKKIKKDFILKRNFERIGNDDEDFGKWKVLMQTLASNPSQNIDMPITPRKFFPSSRDYRGS